MELIIGQPAQGAASGAPIVNGSDATFARDVIETSQQLPVIVDFWAPWCGPCKQLSPALEKAVTAARGRVKLVKIDIDKNPGVAGQLRIQSIPTVHAFLDGRPVDGFQGALPESKIKDFVARLVRAGGGAGPVETAMEQADAAAEVGDHDTAATLYGRVLQHDPENANAAGKLAHAHIKLGETDAAREVLAAVPAAKANKAEVVSARAALEFAEKAAEARGRLDPLRAAVDRNPDNHRARFDLAETQAAMGRSEEAIDNLLHIIRTDRGWNDEAARLQLLKVFEALGPTDPAVLSGRRRLSSLLFS